MLRTGIRRFNGLPKEIVVVMLGVALTLTVGFDLTGSSARPPGRPSASAASPTTVGAAGKSHLAAPRTTVATVAPSTTTSPPATVAPASTTAPPKPVPIHTVSNVAPAPKPAPKPVPAKPVAAPAAPVRSARTVPFGVYVGAGDPSGVASFAAATGTHPTYAADYLPNNGGWAGISSGSTLSWLTSSWRASGYTLVLGIPMIPTDASGNPQGTLAAGAAGQYNSYFVSLADGLVSGGEANTILRLGWEFNGSWFPWSVTNPADAANYVKYFQNIVNAMRSVPGEAFKFVWNPNCGGSFGSAYTPDQTYPGNSYVDYVGVDLYDESWSTPPTPQSGWANQLSQPWGLNWLVSFAAAEGKPIVLPEWGADVTGDGHGMGDDPYFINQMGAWIAQNNVAWTAYFNYDGSDASHDLLDGQFPSMLSTFRTVFG